MDKTLWDLNGKTLHSSPELQPMKVLMELTRHLKVLLVTLWLNDKPACITRSEVEKG